MPESGGLFILDAENAGSTPWEFDSIGGDAGCVFELSDAAKAHGTYGYRVTMDGGSGHDECYGVKAFSSAKTEVYVRCYLYIDSSFQLPAAGVSYIFVLRDGTTSLCYLAIRNGGAGEGNPDRWVVGGQSITTLTDTPGFSVGEWHIVEMHWKAGTGANGGIEVWIDDYESPWHSELDNNLTAYAADDITIGPYHTAGADPVASSVLYFDDIKADTSAIGVYSDAGGTTYIPQMMAYYRRLRS